MPTLLRLLSDDNTNIPFAWKCTECDAVFDFDGIDINPSREQIESLNEDFTKHCAKAHPGSRPVVGLALP
jgi:hypothetical protein